MNLEKLKSAWRHRFPGRGRRFWRYVSPRRHGLGVVLLAVLVGMLYVFWYFTNDRYIRHEAESYLETLTGGQVKIARARMSIFGTLELYNVRLVVPGDRSPEPLFSAASVALKYRMWDLIAHHKLEASEITCTEPTIVLLHNLNDNKYNANKLLTQTKPRESKLVWNASLPAIRVQKAKVRAYETAENGKIEKRGEKNLFITFEPDPNGVYLIRLEEDRGSGKASFEGSIAYNLATGQYNAKTHTVLEGIGDILPAMYDNWRGKYNVRGEVALSARGEAAPGRQALEANMMGVRLKLPDPEGGLELTDVAGKMLFEPNSITLENLTGRVRQLNNALITLSGRYEGYDTNCPFDLELAVEHMTLPDANGINGPLRDTCRMVHQEFAPSGPLSIKLHLRRSTEGKISHEGQAMLEGMSMCYRWAPYRMDNLRGLAKFDANGVMIPEITGSHGPTSIRVWGKIGDLLGPGVMDLHIDANDLAIDADLERTVPPNILPGYRDLSPRGIGNIGVFISRDKGQIQEKVSIHGRLDGRASMCFARFPYRVEKISGDVFIADDKAVLKGLRGSRGDMICAMDGEITSISNENCGAEITLTGKNLPLDEMLASSLPPENRATLKSVNPSGMVSEFKALLSQKPRQYMTYNIDASITGASFKIDALPYLVTDANGFLSITPEKVIIRDIRGRHGKTPVNIPRGEAYWTGKSTGVDIDVLAENLRLDQELYDALPPDVQRIWQRIKPLGPADLTMKFSQNTPSRPGKTDYRMTIDAKDLQVVCSDFPLRLPHMKGRAVAVPGLVTLEHFTASDGNMSFSLQGQVNYDQHREELDVSARFSNVPINAELLDALPGELALAAKKFQKTGSCDMDIRKLHFVRQDANALPSTSPATQTSRPVTAVAATQPGGISWEMEGTLSCRGAVVDLGLGDRTITGSATGKASRSAEGLALDAQVNIDEVMVGRQRLTEVKGRVLKAPKATALYMDDMEARAYDGKIAGKMKVDLTDPPKYGLSLSVEEVGLRNLVQDAMNDPNAARDIDGLVSGIVQFTSIGGKPSDRQAAGKLRISKGSLYKLPVMLGLFQVMTLTLPSQSAFTEGEFTYHLKGEKLIFPEIYLRGPGISLLGSGQVNLKNDALKLAFLVGPDVPRLSGLGGLVEQLAKQVNEIQVTGTISRPITRSVPLRSVDEAIRKLYGMAGEE